MRLTLREFNQLYTIYKNDFDLELCLRLNRKTYSQLKKEVTDTDWI
jgi:hypothetical protein